MSTVQGILARMGFARSLGVQMNGLRDMYGVFGWKSQPCFTDFLRKYKRQAVARRVVHAYPDALWADPPIVTGDQAFQDAWQKLTSKHPVFPTLQKLDKLCRIGKYAVLVVGFNDSQPIDKPISPVRDATKPREVIFLQPYCEASAAIKSYDEDTKSPRYGLPQIYTINPGEFDKLDGTSRPVLSPGTQPKPFDVHWSRILHISENALESGVMGTSCLEPIYNDLDDLEKISGGAAEVFWLNSNRGMHVDVDKEMELKPADAAALEEEIDEYANGLRRIMRTRGVKVTNLGTDFLDPGNVYDVCISNISAGTGIPKRVLSGSEAGQLASQQDRANWADRCDERISEYGNPVVLMPFLRMMIDAMVLPQPQQLIVKWPDAFKMNPLERAQTSAQMARSAANLARTLFTVEQINHQNAIDATEQPIKPAFGGTFGANATQDPSKSSSGTSKPPSGTPKSEIVGPGSTTPQEPQMQPALRPKAKIDYELLTVDECRQIIGFGKHMPVFDESQDSTGAPPTPEPTLEVK